MHTNIAFLAAVVLLPWGGAQAQSLCDQMAADCADMTGITTRTACYAQVQQCYTELGGEPMPPDAAPPAPPPVPEYVPISPPLEATPEPPLGLGALFEGAETFADLLDGDRRPVGQLNISLSNCRDGYVSECDRLLDRLEADCASAAQHLIGKDLNFLIEAAGTGCLEAQVVREIMAQQ